MTIGRIYFVGLVSLAIGIGMLFGAAQGFIVFGAVTILSMLFRWASEQ